MQAVIRYQENEWVVDFSLPIDISIPLRDDGTGLEAFYLPGAEYRPFRYGSTVLSTREGGACNCEVLTIAPHGNGTHTECVGHISLEKLTIHECLKEFIVMSEVITITPEVSDEDACITRESVAATLKHHTPAVILRTLPNEEEKMTRRYSGTNPPFLAVEAAEFLRDRGVKHLLLDLPSVDRETDGGALRAHHCFWDYPASPRTEATITELIYVPNSIPDGIYLLNIQIASLQTDASPSKPVIYAVKANL
ncbi:MAG: cyclase family protein [Candidatus Kapaibacterium sp.]